MTKLFAVVIQAGLHVDASNDNLSDSDSGMIWDVPLTKNPESFPHLAFVALAIKILGDVFRGYAYHPEGFVGEGDPFVQIFLSAEYNDAEQV